jgi:hypothetical protein
MNHFCLAISHQISQFFLAREAKYEAIGREKAKGEIYVKE